MHAPVRPQFSSDVETQSAEPRRASSERWATRSAWRGRQNAGGSAELESLSDDTLVARLRAQLGDEREACARVLRLMAEVDRRRLYAQAACSSMFDPPFPLQRALGLLARGSSACQSRPPTSGSARRVSAASIPPCSSGWNAARCT
jgi:hypothetical protein